MACVITRTTFMRIASDSTTLRLTDRYRGIDTGTGDDLPQQ